MRRAVILDADHYQMPVFSADGCYLAIRGNAYENSLAVFGFPSLGLVLATVLGEPHRSGKLDPAWHRQYRAWSRHNIAFGTQPGVLWVGTPAGMLLEIDLGREQAASHDVLGGSRVTALASTGGGGLVIATGEGELVLASLTAVAGQDDEAASRTPQALAEEFLNSTIEAPDDGRLEDYLDVTDGTRTWGPGTLKAVTTATETDPTWLRLRVAINKAIAREE
jgi:hypothetical protein